MVNPGASLLVSWKRLQHLPGGAWLFSRLVNRLVQLGKPFQLMVYPNRTHCICEGDGTTVHLFNLLTRYLNEHLPAR